MERQNEIERLLQAWFREQLDAAWRMFREHVVVPNDVDQRYLQRDLAESRREALADDWRAGRYHRVPPDLLGKLDCPPDMDSRAYALLASQAMQARAHVLDAIGQWSDGQHDYKPSWRPELDPDTFPGVTAINHAAPVDRPSPSATIVPASHAAVASVMPHDDTPSIAEAVEDHLRMVKRDRKPTEKDYKQTVSNLRQFVEAMGSNRTVASISRRDASRFFKALQEVPTHAERQERFRGLTVFQIAERARSLDLTPISALTVNGRIGDVRVVFAGLVRDGTLEANPFDGLRAREAGFQESERGWSFDQLSKIFRNPIMTGCAGPKSVFEPGSHLVADWRFWAILIAATSGARIGEIAQLWPSDIMQNEGVWVLNISRDGDKRAKNRASIRRTPIHSEVIRIGLIELARERDRLGEKLLLPGVPAPVQGSASHGLTKWMSEKARDRLAPDAIKGQGWHSFRHTLQELSREAENLDSVSDRLAGRKPAGAGGSYGRYRAPLLQKALEKIIFPASLRAIPARFPATQHHRDHGDGDQGDDHL
ncbi:site-specific integrase [Tanticharoenia sakaeratensis]|nr:site-specific integrase [Tanticharoenia sakaeratensis]GBQ21380.1 phage integrase [Tanticharoenia sakaeratensis NBRC 103193]